MTTDRETRLLNRNNRKTQVSNSQEDAMIMALAGMLEQNVKYKNREPKSKSNGQDKSNVKTNDNESGSTTKKNGLENLGMEENRSKRWGAQRERG